MYAASNTVLTQTDNNKLRSSSSLHIEQAVYASRVPVDFTGILTYIIPTVFHIKFESTFPEKIPAETKRKIHPGLITLGGLFFFFL